MEDSTQGVLDGWTVVALRSAAQNARLRPAVEASGAAFIGLPVLRLVAATEPPQATDDALRRALAAPQCIFVSPAAVRFAAQRTSLQAFGGEALAVGSATAAALRRMGLRRVTVPHTMTSEGLLALPALDPPAAAVGVVGAAGGRGLLQATLRTRGAEVREAFVYRRCAGRLDRRHFDALAAARRPLALLLTSAEALQRLLATLPATLDERLRAATVVASSERLRQLALDRGFTDLRMARSPRWPALCAALAGMPSPAPSGSMPSRRP